jgi:HAE1 family hydrophobic/amphiphilic exporter-1
MTITELSIKRPILVIVLFLAITFIGLFAYTQLKYETFPSMTVPVIMIATSYDGASASVVESAITRKIEEAISGVNNVNSVESTSQEGSSSVTVNFRQGTDVNIALRDVQDKVNEILDVLPKQARKPTFYKYSSNDSPVMTIGVTGNLSSRKFSSFLTNTLKPRLSKQPGVASINLIGLMNREIRVNVDSQKLQAYGISVIQLSNIITNANLDFPTGKVKDRDGQYVIRLTGKLSSLERLKNLIIKDSPNGQVLLSDVADVQDSSEEQSSISRVNSSPFVGIEVYKQSGANQVEVCKAIRNAIHDLEEEYASINLQFVITQDDSTYTLASVKAVKDDLILAILLVAVVMLIFLHSLRNSMIVMVAIPTSLVTTLIGMWATGCTINMITLLAMSLVIGILVDDSIVVLENIHHHLEKGEEQKEAALKGRNEIGFTALAITMVDVVVFLPLSLVNGMIGGIIHQFSLVVVMSTLVSLFVSFTVTPMLASRFSKAEVLSGSSFMGRLGLWFEAKYKRLVGYYLDLLKWCLKNRGKVLMLVAMIFVAVMSLIPAGFIGSEFVPQGDQGRIAVKIVLPTRSTLEQTDCKAKQVEKVLGTFPEVDKIFTNISSGGMDDSAKSNTAQFTVTLVAKSKRDRSTDEVASAIKDRLDLIPGIVASAHAASDWGDDADIQYVVTGPNWNKVYQAALKVKQMIARVPGTKDVRLSTEASQPEIQVSIDRDKMTQLGLDINDVGSVLQTGFTGNTDSKFRDDEGEETNIRVVYDSLDRSRTDNVGMQSFVNTSGQVVQLNQFATLVNGSGPNKLSRKDRNYAITVSSMAVGRTSGIIADEIDKMLMHTPLPDGISCQPAGMTKEQDTAFASLGIALLAALLFVYLIMTALYNSFIYPFVVMFSVPLALIGAILALGLTNNSLTIFSILGIIMLVGLVSKNAILLVDFANRARSEGAGVIEALVEAGRERLRPILMTTLTMILGMFPLALSHSVGSEYKQGLGWALIGGLTSSMLMTLVVVPIIYILVEQVRERLLRQKQTATQ